MVHILSAAETVEEVLIIFVFVSKRLDFPALSGLLALMSSRLTFFLGLRWVAALATLVVCHIRIFSNFFLPLFAVAGVMSPLFIRQVMQ